MPRSGKTARMTTAEAVVRTMVLNGIENIFCLPGVQNNFLFDALHGAQNRLRSIHTRHEQGAAYMALGAAMATGEPSVYAVVPGPGILNTTAALSTAYACTAPVLALTGQIPSTHIGRGLGMLHEIPDQLGILKSLTKWAERITTPADAPRQVDAAFRQLKSGRRRPVALECPMDIWPRQADMTLPQSAASGSNPSIDPDAVDAAARVLGNAERPLIVVGAGALEAGAEVAAVAELLQAPVCAHRMGLGVLDSRHPLSVSAAVGYRLWADADVVLGIGTRLQMQQMQWGTDDHLQIVRIDVDPTEIDRIAPPSVGVVGDAAMALRTLLDVLPKHKRSSRIQDVSALKAKMADELAGKFKPQGGFLEAIRAELPENGIFVDELTQLGYVSRLMFPVYRPRTFLSPGYQGTLGWGVAAAMGAKVGRPDAPVVAITGDGGFMFNVQELATAVQHRIAVVIVLMNDNAFGNVRRTQVEEFGNRTIASDLVNPDFGKLADSFGALALKATTPEQLRRSLRQAFAADVPAVIEVPVGSMPSPWSYFYQPRARPRAAAPADDKTTTRRS